MAEYSMADEPQQYTNADLDTAETLLIAAGQPELAKALRFYTEGNRNMVQGVWGQSFVNSFEQLIDKQTKTIAEAVTVAVRQEVAAQMSPFHSRLERAETAITELYRETLQGRLTAARRSQLTSVVEEVEANLDLLRALPGWKSESSRP